MGNRRKPARRRFQIHAGKAEIEDRRFPIPISDIGEDLIPSSRKIKEYRKRRKPNDREKLKICLDLNFWSQQSTGWLIHRKANLLGGQSIVG
jgi:hypothetical protein